MSVQRDQQLNSVTYCHKYLAGLDPAKLAKFRATTGAMDQALKKLRLTDSDDGALALRAIESFENRCEGKPKETHSVEVTENIHSLAAEALLAAVRKK